MFEIGYSRQHGSGFLPVTQAKHPATDKIRKQLLEFSKAFGSRKSAVMHRKILRRAVRKGKMALELEIKSQGLIDSGLMSNAVRIITPKQQDVFNPWVSIYLGGKFGFQSKFLNAGTKDRYTKKGAYRGKIQPPHKIVSKAHNRSEAAMVNEYVAGLEAELDKWMR